MRLANRIKPKIEKMLDQDPAQGKRFAKNFASDLKHLKRFAAKFYQQHCVPDRDRYHGPNLYHGKRKFVGCVLESMIVDSESSDAQAETSATNKFVTEPAIYWQKTYWAMKFVKNWSLNDAVEDNLLPRWNNVYKEILEEQQLAEKGRMK